MIQQQLAADGPAGRMCRAALILALFHANTAFAADSAGNYAIWGLGQSSCNQFVKANENGQIADYKHFVAGYLSALNRVTPGVFRVTGDHSMTDNMNSLLEYCGQNRMDSLDQALQGLVGKSMAAAGTGAGAWGRVPPERLPQDK